MYNIHIFFQGYLIALYFVMEVDMTKKYFTSNFKKLNKPLKRAWQGPCLPPGWSLSLCAPLEPPPKPDCSLGRRLIQGVQKLLSLAGGGV